MSLSPFVSFQLRFVTCLLTFPRMFVEWLSLFLFILSGTYPLCRSIYIFIQYIVMLHHQ